MMPQDTPEAREARLPRWAREELARLRANAEYHERKLREIETGESPYFQEHYTNNEFVRRFLPDYPVSVVCGDEVVTFKKERAMLHVQSNGLNLAVYPSSSNTFLMETVSSRAYLERLGVQYPDSDRSF